MPAKSPLCFILMPFGRKKDSTGREIDFDAVYERLIAPAVREAGMEPLRADEEKSGGIIHKPMFERLILCEYGVADLTTANANVFYELGVRHAVRPHATVLLFAEGSGQLPFDVGQLRAIPYGITTCGGPMEGTGPRVLLTERLREARHAAIDSPLFQLVDNYPQVDHTKTDVFRDLVEYSKAMKDRLAQARCSGLDAVKQVDADIQSIADCETGVVIDLFLSYRAVKGWDEMIDLVSRMAPELASTVMVQEQFGLALNRMGKRVEAERILLDLIARRGPSSESYAILGRVYKDRWEEALKNSEKFLAKGLLDKAIDSYLKGFEADWRDAYPGINAVTLMELRDPPDPRREQLTPVVQYAVERKIATGRPDYWDYATRLELAVLAKEEGKAVLALSDALASMRETWEAETTVRNLRLIREARERRKEAVPWVDEIEKELERKGNC